MLDLAIPARLTTIASERDAQPAPAAAPPMLAPAPSRGLRVPVAPASLPRRSARPVVPTKRSNPIGEEAVMKTINTWLDGYLELRHRAFADRGAIELADGTRWPRTTGEQVAAIAAAFTPAIRANASPRVVNRWRSTLADIQRDALADLHDTYAGTRAFWATLEAVAVYLDNLALRPPAARAWMALFAVIDAGTDTEPRNAGPSGDGPFKHFDGVQTFDDLYNAEFKYLRDLRGVDQMKFLGRWRRGRRRASIPRTTNADVVALADY